MRIHLLLLACLLVFYPHTEASACCISGQDSIRFAQASHIIRGKIAHTNFDEVNQEFRDRLISKWGASAQDQGVIPAALSRYMTPPESPSLDDEWALVTVSIEILSVLKGQTDHATLTLQYSFNDSSVPWYKEGHEQLWLFKDVNEQGKAEVLGYRCEGDGIQLYQEHRLKELHDYLKN